MINTIVAKLIAPSNQGHIVFHCQAWFPRALLCLVLLIFFRMTTHLHVEIVWLLLWANYHVRITLSKVSIYLHNWLKHSLESICCSSYYFINLIAFFHAFPDPGARWMLNWKLDINISPGIRADTFSPADFKWFTNWKIFILGLFY